VAKEASGDGPVTLALLCASTGNGLEAADATRLADDLAAALHAAGASVVERTTGIDVTAQLHDVARLARDAGEPLLLCADDLVAHPALLWMLATEPAGRSTALVVADPEGGLHEDRGRVVPGPGAGGVRFAGALCIAPADLPLLAEIAATGGSGGGVATDVRNALDLLLPALLDAGLVPVATRVRLLRAARVRTGAELAAARAAVAAVDEDAARLRLAVKEKDDFFTTYAVSTWSPLVTRWCARLGLTPSGVTALSVLFAVAAALAFWQASRPAMIAGAVLLYLGFVLDCVDGQLARYTRRFGAFGGWLDTMADRAKEYAVYAGLAAGAERAGLPYAWPLAITAIVLQTVRHMTDAWYGALHDEAAARPAPVAQSGVGARLSAASNRVQADTGSVAYWLKRIVVFPIGERWALMAVLAALTNGRVALAAVVGWGLLAAGYTLALRSLRSLSMRVGVLNTVDTARHRDDGPLVRAVLGRAGAPQPLLFAAVPAVAMLGLVVALLTGVPGGGDARLAVLVAAVLALVAGTPARASHAGPLDWLVPAGLRAVEYLLVVAAGLAGGVPPAVVFLLLFTLALHHYDLTARMEKGAPASGGNRPLLGWDGRILLLAAATAAGQATLGAALLAGVVGGGFLAGAIRDWRTAERTG
jgi:phosphatidylglycerophosphate synthase